MSPHPCLAYDAPARPRTDALLLGCPPGLRTHDDLLGLAARLFKAEAGLMVPGEASRSWLGATRNFPVHAITPGDPLCREILSTGEAFIARDTRADPRCKALAEFVGPSGFRFLAGAPLVDSEGLVLGILWIAARGPRSRFDDAQSSQLMQLAALASAQLNQGRALRRGQILDAFSDASALAMVTTDDRGRVTLWNAAAERLFGHPRAAILGRPLEIIMPERFRREHAAGLRRMSAGGRSRLAGKTVEVVGLHADGREFPIEISISAWDGPAGKEFGAQIQDISERRAKEAGLERLAHHDPLTGLPNRTGFLERAHAGIAGGVAATMLVYGLGGLEMVNDTLGHEIGDAFLLTASIRLRACVAADNLIARIDGDEFAVLVTGADESAAGSIAEALLGVLGRPFEVAGHAIHASASVGVACAPQHALDGATLLARAHLAMLQAKREPQNASRLFDAGMATALASRKAFNEELRRAAGAGQWELYYQPQVRLHDGVVTGMEALLRWRHPQRGLLAPAAFLPLLETHLAAHGVGRWILDEACRQLAEWRARGCTIPRIAVNLFASQLRSGDLGTEVDAALARHGLAPRDLELEVTETVALGSDERLRASIDAMREKGVAIAFDDFGTGFASLTSLNEFPVSRLKIDKSFVRDLCEEPISSAVVSAVVSIGRSLGIDVTAEGVETDWQRRQLLGLGCRSGQGYLFGRPMPADLVPHKVRFAG